MGRVARGLRFALLLSCAVMMTACGSNSPSSTEQGAIDNLRSVLSSYDAAAPTDVASTGKACAQALADLKGSSLLAAAPGPGKDLRVRHDLQAAYLNARQGFSDCALGARSMSYVDMARSDAEILGSNQNLQQARSPGG